MNLYEDKAQPYSRTQTRYEVGGKGELDDYVSSRAKAFELATRVAKRCGAAYVYDWMARRGRPDRWTVDADGNARVQGLRPLVAAAPEGEQEK